jgi:rubrerythrin
MADLTPQPLADLRSAFAAEAMNAQRYAYFAEVAEIEGHAAVAKLFRDLTATAACVARGHLDFLQHAADPTTSRPIDDTRAQLVAALAGAAQEANEFYPQLAGKALDQGQADVASWLETLSALKRSHTAKLDQVLATLAEPAGRADGSGVLSNGGKRSL